jgi:hypothetical protein
MGGGAVLKRSGGLLIDGGGTAGPGPKGGGLSGPGPRAEGPMGAAWSGGSNSSKSPSAESKLLGASPSPKAEKKLIAPGLGTVRESWRRKDVRSFRHLGQARLYSKLL